MANNDNHQPMRKYIYILFSYCIIASSCSSPIAEDATEYYDSLYFEKRTNIEWLDLLNTNIFSPVQTYYQDSVIFLFSRGKDWTDTFYQMSVIMSDSIYVRININFVYPYEAGKYYSEGSDSAYLDIYKGYGYVMYWDKWNRIIESSPANTIISNFKKEEPFTESINYFLYYKKTFTYPNASDERPLVLYKKLEDEVVRKIMNEIQAMEKNPRWK